MSDGTRCGTSGADARATILNPPGLYDPSPFGYSHVAVVPAGARLVFVAGQGGVGADGKAVAGGFEAQLDRAFANVATALASQGLAMATVAKLTVLIVDHDRTKLTALADAVGRHFAGPAPTCTLIPVPSLAKEDMLVEVEAVATAPA